MRDVVVRVLRVVLDLEHADDTALDVAVLVEADLALKSFEIGGLDRVAYRADIAFHDAIAEASKNPIAIMVLKMISEPLQEQRRRTNEVLNAPEEGLREHWKIFKAIKSRDPARAREAMRAHMHTAERNWQIASATPSATSPSGDDAATTPTVVLSQLR